MYHKGREGTQRWLVKLVLAICHLPIADFDNLLVAATRMHRRERCTQEKYSFTVENSHLACNPLFRPLG